MPCVYVTWSTCKHAMHTTQQSIVGESCNLCVCALEQISRRGEGRAWRGGGLKGVGGGRGGVRPAQLPVWLSRRGDAGPVQKA